MSTPCTSEAIFPPSISILHISFCSQDGKSSILLMRSIHLFGGFPFGGGWGKSCLYASCTQESLVFRHTWPNYFSLSSFITFIVVFSEPVILLISLFLILLNLETPGIDRKHCISKTKSFFSSLTWALSPSFWCTGSDW